jgi:hypothetical protein
MPRSAGPASPGFEPSELARSPRPAGGAQGPYHRTQSGPTGDGTGFIISYRTYLTEVRDRTAAQKRAGGSMDQAVETVTAARQHGRSRPKRNSLAFSRHFDRMCMSLF